MGVRGKPASYITLSAPSLLQSLKEEHRKGNIQSYKVSNKDVDSPAVRSTRATVVNERSTPQGSPALRVRQRMGPGIPSWHTYGKLGVGRDVTQEGMLLWARQTLRRKKFWLFLLVEIL